MVNQSQTRPIIGLEVHIELNTESKMFCSCKAEHFGALPNTQTCPVCLGLPGSLPVPNKKAIESVIFVSLALNCQTNQFSKFDRKNYFYPDLPKGYQISQYDLPIGKGGKWEIEGERVVRIRRVHLEEDTGKLTHEGGVSLVDFNRSGVPLMEIVTEPDLDSVQLVKTFLQKLQQLVRCLGVSEADMEKGQMRCEPNVNLEIKEGGRVFFTPIVEIKNVNSFRFVGKAIEWEIKRQEAEFQQTRVEKAARNKSTRGWNETQQMTVPQRTKEEAEDYRYFPEPDIPLLHWKQEAIEALKLKLPELPDIKKGRLLETYGLSEDMAISLTITSQLADYFEKVVVAAGKLNLGARQIANFLINKKLDWKELSPEEFARKVSEFKQPLDIPEKQLAEIVEQVLKENASAVEDFKRGKTQSLEFLIGQVARITRGQADPNQVRGALQERLKKGLKNKRKRVI